MSDEYVKTVVITDPNYRPGELNPGPAAAPPAGETAREDDGPAPHEPYPGFDDTSWLT